MMMKEVNRGAGAPRIVFIPPEWVADIDMVVVRIGTLWDQTPPITVEINHRFLMKDVKTQLFTPLQGSLGYLNLPRLQIRRGDIVRHNASTLILYGYSHYAIKNKREGVYVHGFSFSDQAGVVFSAPRNYRYILHDIRLRKDGIGSVPPSFIVRADDNTIANAPVESFSPAPYSNIAQPIEIRSLTLFPGGKLTDTVRGLFVFKYEEVD